MATSMGPVDPKAAREAELSTIAGQRVATRVSRAIELFGPTGNDGATAQDTSASASAAASPRRAEIFVEAEHHQLCPSLGNSSNASDHSQEADDLLQWYHSSAQEPSPVVFSDRSSGLAEELAALFPTLDLDLVSTVISEISRIHPHYSAEQLKEEAVESLLEITGEVTTRRSGDDMTLDAQACLDESLAALLALDERLMLRCVEELVVIMRRIEDRPNAAQLRQLDKQVFEAAVGRLRPAVTLVFLAGFEEFQLDGRATLVFHGHPHTSIPFLRVKEALEELLRTFTPAVRSYPVSRAYPASRSSRARRVVVAVPASASSSAAHTRQSTAVAYAPHENSANGATRLRKRDRLRALFRKMGGKETGAVSSSSSSDGASSVQSSMAHATHDASAVQIELLETVPGGSSNASTSEHEEIPQQMILRTSALACGREVSEAQEAESLVGWAR